MSLRQPSSRSVTVTISTSGYSQKWLTESDAQKFFGNDEYNAIIFGMHPEYFATYDEDNN